MESFNDHTIKGLYSKPGYSVQLSILYTVTE